MNSNRLIYAAFAAIILCSCDGGRVEEPEKKSSNFSYVDIEYLVGKYDSMEEVVKNNDPIIINNFSGTEQTYIFQPQNNIYERSDFGSRDERAFRYIDVGQKVKIPTAISEDGTLLFDDGIKWLYTEAEQRLRPEIDISNVIKPNHRLVLTSSFTLKTLTAGYKLYLTGSEFGEITTVEGWWSGVFFIGYDLDYSIEPLP